MTKFFLRLESIPVFRDHIRKAFFLLVMGMMTRLAGYSQCTNCTPLPLHRLDLSAYQRGGDVYLTWIAENELNTRNFIIQRSDDGNTYVSIGTVPMSGLTNIPTTYTFTDQQRMLQGIVTYYRVLAEDNTNRYGYSNIILLRADKRSGTQFWPSPFDNTINISYSAAANSRITINLIDNMGKTIRQSDYSVMRGSNQLSLSDLEKLPRGIYFIRMHDLYSGESFVQELVK